VDRDRSERDRAGGPDRRAVPRGVDQVDRANTIAVERQFSGLSERLKQARPIADDHVLIVDSHETPGGASPVRWTDPDFSIGDEHRGPRRPRFNLAGSALAEDR
jgi:hypothetical protein